MVAISHIGCANICVVLQPCFYSVERRDLRAVDLYIKLIIQRGGTWMMIVSIGVDVEVLTQISYASVAASRWVHSTTAGGEMNALAER